MWYIAIEDAIAAQPETLGDILPPELLGQWCGEQGDECLPDHFYGKLTDMELFVLGWREGRAVWEMTQDYESDIEDRLFNMRGC